MSLKEITNGPELFYGGNYIIQPDSWSTVHYPNIYFCVSDFLAKLWTTISRNFTFQIFIICSTIYNQVRAMVIINPGNPTGQCLSVANLKEIIRFCYQENLVLLGDEVYQQNIYQDERPFISARKVNDLMALGT